MGSKDESYPSILYDPSPSSSSSATQPLLSSVVGDPSPAPPSSAILSSSSSDDSYAPISYVHGRRPFRDLPFLILFLLLSLATFVIGFVALARRNPSAPLAASFVYDRSSSACVLPSSSSDRVVGISKPFLKDLISTLVPTLLLAGPAAVSGLLFLLRRCARQLIYFAVPFFVIIPAGLNVYWFVACALSASCRSAFPLAYRILVLAFVFLLISIIAWIIIANWHRVELTVRIVRVAATALEANAALLFVLPALGIGLLVYFAPIIVFLVFSTWNGRMQPKEVEGTGGEYYKCVWRQDRWVPAYFALVIVTMIWSAAAMLEAKVFVISGTVAQWYFSKGESKPNKSLRSSLRNAFGPSFGTVCFSGMVMGPVRLVRAIVDSAKENEGATGFINIVIRCCANFFLASFDFVNKFTINFVAITGEGYCSAAKMTYELLKRNLLSAVFVETVSTRVLVGTIFVMSSVYAVAICAILKAAHALESNMYIVAALAWLLLMVILGYFVHVLDNVIDTVYVCYAIDRDKGEVCKQDVHEVYVHLPISRNHRSAINRTSLVV